MGKSFDAEEGKLPWAHQARSGTIRQGICRPRALRAVRMGSGLFVIADISCGLLSSGEGSSSATTCRLCLSLRRMATGAGRQQSQLSGAPDVAFLHFQRPPSTTGSAPPASHDLPISTWKRP